MALHGAIAPLPGSVRELLRRESNTHPGLHLDKYAETWSLSATTSGFAGDVQRQVVDDVVRLSQAPPEGVDFAALAARRRILWKSLKATVMEAETVGPFTLHLARASALENAGVCMHPVYGCVHLPGSGIKGMSRAYAETVWLPEQPDEQRARSEIAQVFGYSSDGGADTGGKSGAIVFHDAWPVVWPKLQADILNSHHSKYYGAADHAVPPPGDWEEPIPVCFLAVASGTRFQFALSPRRHVLIDDDAATTRLLGLAQHWLERALQYLGAGAKTAAGYGTFRVISASAPHTESAVSPSRKFAIEEYELELLTPAFLAGPHQPDQGSGYSPAECDLRPATLRGMLRWWWRTQYAGWVRPGDLRRLESTVWGDTKQAGAVRIVIQPVAGSPQPVAFDRRTITHSNHLPEPPNKKTTQGLTYHTFGMDENKGRRFFRLPGTKWRITITSRDTRVCGGKTPILANSILHEARSALWLLCRYGGVGAKNRRGFGALAVPAKLPVVDIAALAQQPPRLLVEAGISPVNVPPREISPAWKQALGVADVETPWKNYWLALDRVGAAAQQFAQKLKHQLPKKALGLPRNVRTPFSGAFHEGSDVARTKRHSSPIQYHLDQGANGCYVVRIVAFPSPQLPDLETSRAFLTEAIATIRENLTEQVASHSQESAVAASVPIPAVRGDASQPVPKLLPKPGHRVSARLLAEKTGKGGWKAKHEPSQLSGAIQNSADVPGDKQPGDVVDLIVASVNPREMAFRFPTAADEARAAKPPKPPAKGPNRR